MENAVASTGTLSEPQSLSEPALSSLRMSPVSFPAMEDVTSGSFSRRWKNAGIRTSSGEFSTANITESPNDAVACSLSDILVTHASDRFFLSPQAAEGLLRRSAGRKRDLPPALDAGLRRVAAGQTREVRRLTPTEYEMLQGFPPGWTILDKQPARKKHTRKATLPS